MASRKRPFEILLETHPKLAVAARKKFRSDQPESSADSVVTDDTHIIFFDAFRHYPIKVDEFEVQPKYWALAFLQSEIEKSADILCRSIFTAEHLAKRNQKGVDGLPNIEKVAIYRAAKWMTNKFQDPYSYTPGPWPNEEEQSAIRRAFETFDTVYPKVGLAVVQIFNGDVTAGMNADISSSTPVVPMEENDVLEFATEMDSGEAECNNRSTNDIEKQIHRMCEDFQYDEAFNICMKMEFPNLGNAAHVARDLTKFTIPQNNDIFVDAVQFSKGRWAKAFQKNDCASIADILFRKYLKLDFNDTDSEFHTFEDFCPTKRLALIRAVAWILMAKERNLSDVYSFDSGIPAHNLFLSVAEIKRIEDALSKKYGVRSSNSPIIGDQTVPVPVYTTLVPLSPVSAAPDTMSSTLMQLPMEIGEQSPRTTCVVNPTVMNSIAAFSPVTDVAPLNINFETSLAINGNNQPNRMDKAAQKNVTIHDCEIKGTVWKEAYRKFRLEEGAVQAGKFLFEELFQDHDVRHGCVSGRGDKFKYPSNKVDAIFEALAIMRDLTMSSPGKGPNGTVKQWTPSERKEMTRKIFVEHRNYLARKISSDCSANCPQCLQ